MLHTTSLININAFYIWRPRTKDSLNPEGQNLMLLKSMSNDINFIRRLSQSIFSVFGVKCAPQPKKTNQKTFIISPLHFGGSKSFKVINVVPPKSSPAVLTMISKSVAICNHSHAWRVNSEKYKFCRGTVPQTPSFKGNIFTQRHEIWSQETRVSIR